MPACKSYLLRCAKKHRKTARGTLEQDRCLFFELILGSGAWICQSGARNSQIVESGFVFWVSGFVIWETDLYFWYLVSYFAQMDFYLVSELMLLGKRDLGPNGTQVPIGPGPKWDAGPIGPAQDQTQASIGLGPNVTQAQTGPRPRTFPWWLSRKELVKATK